MKPDLHNLESPVFREKGAALLTALILLIAITLLTLGALGTSLLELRMANNDEMQMSALQMAQSAVDDVIAINNKATDIVNPDPAKQFFKLSGLVNDSNCTPAWGDADGGCTQTTIALDAPLDGTGSSKVRVTSKTESIAQGPPTCKNAAAFDIESNYDAPPGKGKAYVAQGWLLCDHLGAEQLNECVEDVNCKPLEEDPHNAGGTVPG